MKSTKRIKTAAAVAAGVVLIDFVRDWKWSRRIATWFAQDNQNRSDAK